MIEFFLAVLGGFLGGFCAHTIIEHYHLSGFFVWVVYALCKAYRKLASEYHPDKIQSKDLPEAFIIFATEKFKEISHAHEMIVKSRKEEKI
ncbi:DnaJ domain-containing protein [Helicobacter pylori]|uniref:DnaJ domain-containing protein n=1 Tax=Helicobacter pylori TaxID=210 RepID=UPI0018E98B49|nr:DnaJ domain-containing protein [Helicobacter pylori]